MKTVNIRQLHERTGALVDSAANGESVLILRRGTPVAELRATSGPPLRRTLPDRHAVLARYPRLAGDSGRFLEDERS